MNCPLLIFIRFYFCFTHSESVWMQILKILSEDCSASPPPPPHHHLSLLSQKSQQRAESLLDDVSYNAEEKKEEKKNPSCVELSPLDR